MKLFDILDEFMSGKKIRKNTMPDDEWLEYDSNGKYMKMKSNGFYFRPDCYHITFKDLISDYWEIIE